MDTRPNQSLKDMAEGGESSGECWRLCQLDSDQLRVERRLSFLSCLSQYAFLSRPTRAPTTGKSLSTFFSRSSLITLCPKRAIILDYLVQRCYTRTARAFAADSTIRHLDADGDELRRPRGEDDSPGITEDALHQADLRQSAYSFLTLCSLPHRRDTTI